MSEPDQTANQPDREGSGPPADDHYTVGELSRRQFLEDVLDVMGDAQTIVLDDGTEVDRADLLTALAEEMDR